MPRILHRRLALLAVATIVAGCGFRLAGTERLDPEANRIYLATSQPHSEFSRALSRYVRLRGGVIVDRRDAADIVLRVLEDSTGQRVLSVSARNLPREYEVFYVLRFDARQAGAPLLEGQELNAQRNYTYDETEVLGKAAEETRLRRDLAEDLAQRVLRRLIAAGSNGV